MEKDNLRGDDVLKLASDTERLYSSLERRCFRFLEFFNYWSGIHPVGSAAGLVQIGGKVEFAHATF